VKTSLAGENHSKDGKYYSLEEIEIFLL